MKSNRRTTTTSKPQDFHKIIPGMNHVAQYAEDNSDKENNGQGFQNSDNSNNNDLKIELKRQNFLGLRTPHEASTKLPQVNGNRREGDAELLDARDNHNGGIGVLPGIAQNAFYDIPHQGDSDVNDILADADDEPVTSLAVRSGQLDTATEYPISDNIKSNHSSQHDSVAFNEYGITNKPKSNDQTVTNYNVAAENVRPEDSSKLSIHSDNATDPLKQVIVEKPKRVIVPIIYTHDLHPPVNHQMEALLEPDFNDTVVSLLTALATMKIEKPEKTKTYNRWQIIGESENYLYSAYYDDRPTLNRTYVRVIGIYEYFDNKTTDIVCVLWYRDGRKRLAYANKVKIGVRYPRHWKYFDPAIMSCKLPRHDPYPPDQVSLITVNFTTPTTLLQVSTLR